MGRRSATGKHVKVHWSESSEFLYLRFIETGLDQTVGLTFSFWSGREKQSFLKVVRMA